jgi:hypothetical protein
MVVVVYMGVLSFFAGVGGLACGITRSTEPFAGSLGPVYFGRELRAIIAGPFLRPASLNVGDLVPFVNIVLTQRDARWRKELCVKGQSGRDSQ